MAIKKTFCSNNTTRAKTDIEPNRKALTLKPLAQVSYNDSLTRGQFESCICECFSLLLTRLLTKYCELCGWSFAVESDEFKRGEAGVHFGSVFLSNIGEVQVA